jgi:uncharacterized protein (TIGR03437 family)
VGGWRAAAQGVWETRAPYPIEATEVSAAALDGKVYAVCGLTPSGNTNALYIYDPYTDAWRAGAPLPIAGGADHCNVAAAGGKLYLLGGLGSLASGGETYEYDPAVDRWQLVARMLVPRGASGVAALGDKIYVAGGLAADGRSLAALEVFDTISRQWTRLADMPTARDHLTAQALNGKVYALSGRVGEVLAANEEYDPALNQWRRRASIPTPRGGLGSGTLNGRIQVFGGEGPSGTPEGTYRQNEEYDPATDTWRSLASMPTPRHGLYGATVIPPGANGAIFTPSGGPRAGAFFSNVQEAFYLPPAEPPGFEATGLRNAASLAPALSPGALVSLFGVRLAAHTQAALRFPLPPQMAAAAVRINGVPAPLLFVSPEQINFQLPHDLSPGTVNVTVTHAGSTSASLTLTLESASPGLFSLGQSGQGQGAVLIANTGLLAGAVPGLPGRAARRGEALEIYCTGLGALSETGRLPLPGQPAPASPPLSTMASPEVTIGGAAAEVLFAGLAPGLAGVYQVNAAVPPGAPAGPEVPVSLRVSGTVSNTVTIAIAP